MCPDVRKRNMLNTDKEKHVSGAYLHVQSFQLVIFIQYELDFQVCSIQILFPNFNFLFLD